MALIKCPECGKEISDSVTRCSYCGINIQEIESYNKKDKLNTTIKKIGLVILAFLLLFICINLASSHFRMKTFEGYVDEFIHDWDRMAEASQKDPKDLLAIDIYEKALRNDMRDISQAYVKFSDKTKANDYLEKHAFKDMFEYVMELTLPPTLRHAKRMDSLFFIVLLDFTAFFSCGELLDVPLSVKSSP